MSALEPHRDGFDTDALLRRVIEMLESTRSLPLSSGARLDNKDEVLQLLDEAVHRLPDEYRRARWMVKEKAEFLGKMQREADAILEAARQRAERMVQRTEIVREAGHTARRLIEEARDDSRRLRLEAEDYCDQKLAEFEVVLEGTRRTVAAGRVKLSANPGPAPLGVGRGDGPRRGDDAGVRRRGLAAPGSGADGGADQYGAISHRPDGFFDQDRS